MHGVPQPKKGMIIKPKYSKAAGNSGRLLLSPNSLPAKPSMLVLLSLFCFIQID